MEKLTAQLKSGALEKVYLLFGSEDYLIHFYANRLADKSVLEEDRFMNLCVLEGAEATVNKIQESTDTYPFMGDVRLTWVKESEWFSGKKGDPEGQEKLIHIIQNMPDTSLLIFEEKNVDKRNAVYKAVQKKGYAAELSQPNEEQMIQFVARELKKENKLLSKETAKYFLQTVGGDMVYQQLELAKLAAYKGEQEIVTPQDIDAICTPQPESDVFKMTDALGSRNRREAMRIYERLVANNEAPARIFYLLCQQIRRIYRVKIGEEKRLSKEECAQFAGVSPKALWIYSKQSGRFRKEQLESLIFELTEMDEKMKTGLLDASDGIERLVTLV